MIFIQFLIIIVFEDLWFVVNKVWVWIKYVIQVSFIKSGLCEALDTLIQVGWFECFVKKRVKEPLSLPCVSLLAS